MILNQSQNGHLGGLQIIGTEDTQKVEELITNQRRAGKTREMLGESQFYLSFRRQSLKSLKDKIKIMERLGIEEGETYRIKNG